ncbi:IS110 family transposase [Nocardia sp. NPDC002869]|uniref:IS110 family transposase n=1 Tax=Nocardia sp. NPDC002869 TaxID=3161032 RepID=UPI00398D389A
MTGTRLGDIEIPASPAGYRALVDFVATFGVVQMIGVEGTSSYGAGLARFLTTEAIEFREVIRPRRPQRRQGKSDPLDAYAAAEQVLACPDGLPSPNQVTELSSRSECCSRSAAARSRRE